MSNMGERATYDAYFTTFNWSRQMNTAEHSIQMRELLTSLVAILTFSPLLTKKHLITWTDNQFNAEVFYAGACKNPEINSIIAEMYMAQIQGNFSIKLEHISGKANKEADLLSQNGHREYVARHPYARYLQPVIPNNFTNLISIILSLIQ